MLGGQKPVPPKGKAGGKAEARGAHATLVVRAEHPVRVSNELFVLDPSTHSWSQVRRTPSLRREAAALVPLADRFLLAFGGWSGGGGGSGSAPAQQDPWSDALHALHLPTMRWFLLAAPGLMPTPRHGGPRDSHPRAAACSASARPAMPC